MTLCGWQERRVMIQGARATTQQSFIEQVVTSLSDSTQTAQEAAT